MTLRSAVGWIAVGTSISLVLGGTLIGMGEDLLGSASAGAVQAGYAPRGHPCVNGQRPNVNGLELFGDLTYEIDPASVIISGEDSLDEEGARGMLGGLTGLKLPKKENVTREQIIASFSLKVAGKNVCLPNSAASVKSFGWCSFGGTGEHGIRATLHQTLRVEYDGVQLPIPSACPPKCLAWSLDGSKNCEEDLLKPGVTATMYPGIGFPVGKWMSRDAAYSMRAADRLYKEGIFDQSTIAANQSFDIIAGGVAGKDVRNNVACPWDRRQVNCKEYTYQRRLVGTLVRRTYNDLRIGVSADSAGGLQARANFATLSAARTFVVPGPRTNRSRASGGERDLWRRQTQFDQLFNRFCGRTSGDRATTCGRQVAMPNEATGATIVAARDDSLRAMQLCAKLTGERSAGGACMSGRNPLAPEADGDEGTLTAMALDRLTQGARYQDTVGAEGRRITGSGGRTIEGRQQDMGSQWRRGCQRTFARDSLRLADRGESIDPARQRFLQCLLAGGEQ